MATIQKVSGIDFANISKFDGVDISSVGSINLIGKPVTGSLLLDQSYGSGAEAAYSVRKLRTAYTGAAMQVQATSGGATAEIGFTVDNNLDTAALLAFAGTNEVRVSIWYDQSTNGNNATQVTVSNRPIVVAAGGALVEENGRVFLKSGPTLTMIFDIPTVERYDVFSMIKAESSLNSLLLGSETSGSDYLLATIPNNSSLTLNRSVTVAEYKLGGRNYIPTTRGSVYNTFSNINGSSLKLLYFDGDFTYTSTSGFRFGFPGTNASFGGYSQQEFLFYVESGSQVVTSIEENISDYYTENPAPYLLDTYTGAAAAYSLRKLRADYTGFAIKVQDNVGGATQDIGFNSFGELDTAGLFNYGGSNDVFVETWYDQSGNGNNSTQATSANRPKIYDGSTGAVILENGKPAVQFDGSNDFLDSVGLSETTLTSFHVAKPDQTNSGDALLCFDGNTGNGFFRYNSNGTMRVNFFGGLNTSTNYTAAQNLVFALYGTSVAIGYDGAAAETGSATGITTTGVRMGQKGNVDYFNGNAQEIVLYPSDQSANRTGIETNINDFYEVYTVPPPPLLLNSYPNSTAAYSLRKLNANYTGAAVLVQDTVGGATAGIGFDANGDLDTSALISYGGSNDVFVATWYDQSGNGNNSTQPSSVVRPKIYDGTTGTVVDNNGKPTLSFINDRVVLTNELFLRSNAPDAFLISLVAEGTEGTSNGEYFGGITSNSTNFFATYGSSSNYRWRHSDDAGTGNINTSFAYPSPAPVVGEMSLLNLYIESSTKKMQLNGQELTISGNTAWSSTSNYKFNLGVIGRPYAEALSLQVSEFVVWPNQSSTDLSEIQTNIGGYYDIPLAGLLDKYTGAAAGYSLRRLSSTYTGSAIKVQDTVGGATLDVGFDSNGELDTAAIVAYGGSNDVFVETWYDQSGNSNNAVQATSALRPKIYDGATGAVITENGKAAISSLGSTNLSFTAITDIRSVFLTGSLTVVGSKKNWILGHTSFYDYHAGNNSNLLLDPSVTTNTDVVGGTNYRNGVLTDFGTTAQTVGPHLLTLIHLASTGRANQITKDRSNATRSWNGPLQEIIIYSTDESANRTGIETNINTFYSIY